MPFSNAHPGLQSALTARGYAAPTPVQAAILERLPGPVRAALEDRTIRE